MKTARRVAVAVLAALVVAAVVVSVMAWSFVRRPFPQVSGELVVAGLTGPVTVSRDDRGVPSIYADNAADLFRAEGFVHAQDRFFEMDLRRHITAGRLSELVGSAGFETDRVIRTMGWRQVAEAELPTLQPETRQYLQAYADGVNAYIHSTSSPSRMSAEYLVLGQRNPDYTVEDWTPLDSLTWLKAMAWDLRGDYSDEMTRARLAGKMPLKQISEIYPPYPYDVNAPILSSADWSPGQVPPAGSAVPSALTTPATTTATAPAAGPLVAPADPRGGPTIIEATRDADAQRAYAAVSAALASIPALVGRGDGVGSNAWAVAGSRTTTGKPLLANDPHLATGIPGIWYQIGLHCRSTTPDCPFQVSGFSFSGVPGIVIGHNDRVAWGFTNLNPDVSDFYLERTQGDTTLKDGSWVPMTVRTETIKVAGQVDRTITVRSTKHGPILSDVIPDVRMVGDSAPIPGKQDRESYAVSLAWTGLKPSRTADAIFALSTARDFTDFRAAAKLFAVPAQNLVYADVDGHIGYQAPGLVPVRAAALTGAPPGYWPAPGWASSYDWKGFVNFDQLPWVLDPADGIIVTANQAVTRSRVPFLTTEWEYGYRSQRIRELLTTGGKVSPERMSQIQGDTRSLFAPTLVKALLAVSLTSGDADSETRAEAAFTKEAQDLLRTWNFTNPADSSDESAAAAYFNAVWANLLELTFDDEMPTGLQASGGSRWMAAVTGMLKNEKSPWWDDKLTPTVTEGKDEILRRAMVKARLDLTERLGKDPKAWRWGDLHTLTLRHQVLGQGSVPSAVQWLFNVGPFPMPGGSAIVNANGWSADEGYEVNWGPSMRMVVDLANLDGSRWVNQTGASGHATNEHYDDQTSAWIRNETFPWPFSPAAVKKAQDAELQLVPAKSAN